MLALLKRATGGLCWVHPQVYYLFGVGCLFGGLLLCWLWWLYVGGWWYIRFSVCGWFLYLYSLMFFVGVLCA